MVVKTISKPWKIVRCMAFEQEALKKQSDRISMSQLLYCIDYFQNCSADMSRGIDSKTALETAFLIVSDADNAKDSQSLTSRIERLEDLVFKLQNQQQEYISEKVADQEKNRDSRHTEIASDAHEASKKESYENGSAIKSDGDAEKKSLAKVTVFEMWGSVLSQLEVQNSSIYNMLVGTKAYFNGKHVLIDVSNPLLLKMLKDNEFTKTSIKKAIFTVTGKNYPIGPYKGDSSIVVEKDPLEDFINRNKNTENFNIR